MPILLSLVSGKMTSASLQSRSDANTQPLPNVMPMPLRIVSGKMTSASLKRRTLASNSLMQLLAKHRQKASRAIAPGIRQLTSVIGNENAQASTLNQSARFAPTASSTNELDVTP